jgi:hypothetical protein
MLVFVKNAQQRIADSCSGARAQADHSMIGWVGNEP